MLREPSIGGTPGRFSYMWEIKKVQATYSGELEQYAAQDFYEGWEPFSVTVNSAGWLLWLRREKFEPLVNLAVGERPGRSSPPQRLGLA